MSKPDSQPLPLKAALAGPPLAALAALSMVGGDTPPPPVESQASHNTSVAPGSHNPLQPFQIETESGPQTFRPIGPNQKPLAHSKVEVDTAAEIAKTILNPERQKPRIEKQEIFRPNPGVPKVLPPPRPMPQPIIDVLPAPPEGIPPVNGVERSPFVIHEVTKEAADIMRSETVLLSQLGCSGFLIRNEEGAPVGALTAEHCHLAGYDNRRYEGSDGKTYVPLYSDTILAQTGDNMQNLQTVGKVDRFIVNGPKDMNKDLAFAVFEGHTPEEVTENYQHLSKIELENLKPGDVVYNSGWPDYQPGNNPNKQRQTFALTVLGMRETPVTTGENIKVLWTVMPKNQYRTECSYGNSGSEGFVLAEETLPDGSTRWVPKSVGTAAVFVDLTGADIKGDKGQTHNPAIADSNRTKWEKAFGVDLSEAAALCGWAYEVPDEGSGAEVVQVTRMAESIPGYEERYGVAISEKKAREDFMDPTTTKYVLDGLFPNRGGIGDDGKYYLEVIDRVVLYHDKELERTLFGFADDTAENGMSFISVEDQYLKNYLFHDRDNVPDALITPYTGKIIASNNLLVTGSGEIGSEVKSATDWPQGNNIYTLGFNEDGSFMTIPQYMGSKPY